mmetsp:Transcript_45863/g.63726  ORF Transcript_45863/g.63726 Transcript_45863/m.63726 type:complete len:159 (-) Transcript_45863:291-767(-)
MESLLAHQENLARAATWKDCRMRAISVVAKEGKTTETVAATALEIAATAIAVTAETDVTDVTVAKSGIRETAARVALAETTEGTIEGTTAGTTAERTAARTAEKTAGRTAGRIGTVAERSDGLRNGDETVASDQTEESAREPDGEREQRRSAALFPVI